MSLWGSKDFIGSGGTISLDYSTRVVTGAGTTFGQVGAAATGDVIRFGDRSGTYFGDAVIVGIASTTQLSIASTSGLSGAAIASTSFSISQLPKYTVRDPHYTKLAGINTTYDALVYGADVNETQAVDSTRYDLTHAGWVGITTYMCDGELRVKSETLVAMSSIQGDADDDAVLPDARIVILTQPSNVAIGTTGTANFSVAVQVFPSSVTPTFQWQESSDGISFSDLSNDATYSGVTSAGLAVTNTDGSLDGYEYRAVVSVAGGESVTSDSATMSVS